MLRCCRSAIRPLSPAGSRSRRTARPLPGADAAQARQTVETEDDIIIAHEHDAGDHSSARRSQGYSPCACASRAPHRERNRVRCRLAPRALSYRELRYAGSHKELRCGSLSLSCRDRAMVAVAGGGQVASARMARPKLRGSLMRAVIMASIPRLRP